MKMLTAEQIECCRRIGRNETEHSTRIHLVELDALCDMALRGLAIGVGPLTPPPEARSHLPSAIAWMKSTGPGPWVGIAGWLEELAERRGISEGSGGKGSRDTSLEALSSMIKQPSPWQRALGVSCRKCKAQEVKCCRSSLHDFDDWEYRCSACGHTWWIEGMDS